jgi:hypothetical protein
MKQAKIFKTETVQEFLARGGKITKLPSNMENELSDGQVKKLAAQGPAKIITMDEADLFHGEKSVRKGRKKQQPSLDIQVLPEPLKQKLLSRITDKDEDEEKQQEE